MRMGIAVQPAIETSGTRTFLYTLKSIYVLVYT